MAMQYQPTTQATWLRMEDKAAKERIEIVRYLDCGYFVVASGTQPGKRYIASQRDCNCPGHQHHGYCKHSGRVRMHVRWLVRNGLTVDTNPAA